MAKLRKSIKIPVGGIQWKVRFVTRKGMGRISKDEPLGLTDYDSLTIYVNREYMRAQVISTFFHEHVHACCATLQGSNESAEGAMNEEAAANSIGNGLYELLPLLPEIISMIEALCLPEPTDDDEDDPI